MNTSRLIRLKDERLWRLIALGSGSALAALVVDGSSNQTLPFNGQGFLVSDASTNTYQRIPLALSWKPSIAECEEHKAAIRAEPSVVVNRSQVKTPSWMHRTLAYLRLKNLPTPRLLAKGDPAFIISKKLLEKRQDDEMEMQNLVRGALQVRDPETLKELNQKCLELAYGKEVTLKSRQDFVHRHGCTAWTDEVLATLFELGKDRGLVEIGAGNGQWARALTEHYDKKIPAVLKQAKKKKKMFDFVLAYDDQSDLPLDQQIFNKQTKIHHTYFFHQVQPCDPNNFSNTLRQWECRGRMLMLIYPPPGSMALDAAQQYASASEEMNDTVIYVGEGRGGANANDDFFDYLESGGWTLMNMMKVKSLGSKGYEHLYILKRTAK